MYFFISYYILSDVLIKETRLFLVRQEMNSSRCHHKVSSLAKSFILLFVIPAISISILGSEAFGQATPDSSRLKSALADVSKSKSPAGALFRSVAFPGWGQFYNGKYFKSLVVFGTETTFITLATIEWGRRNEHKKNFENLPSDHPDKGWEFEQFRFYEDRRNLFLWITAGIIFLSMFDAYVDAHLYDFDKEEVPDLSISMIPGDKVNILFSVKF